MGANTRDRFLSNWESQARKGILELIVMSALSSREFYGYELVTHIHHHAGVEVSDGTLYAILTRLKTEGLVRTRWETAQRGPARKYYALSDDGRTVLGTMQALWHEVAGAVSAMAKWGKQAC